MFLILILEFIFSRFRNQNFQDCSHQSSFLKKSYQHYCGYATYGVQINSIESGAPLDNVIFFCIFDQVFVCLPQAINQILLCIPQSIAWTRHPKTWSNNNSTISSGLYFYSAYPGFLSKNIKYLQAILKNNGLIDCFAA